MVRINIISAKFDMFDLFLPFVDRYFFIQHSFSIKFCAKQRTCSRKRSKLSSQALNGTMENWTPEAVSKTGIQALLEKIRGTPVG